MCWDVSGSHDGAFTAVSQFFLCEFSLRRRQLRSLTVILSNQRVCFKPVGNENSLSFSFTRQTKSSPCLLVLISWLARLVVLINPSCSSCVIVLRPAASSVLNRCLSVVRVVVFTSPESLDGELFVRIWCKTALRLPPQGLIAAVCFIMRAANLNGGYVDFHIYENSLDWVIISVSVAEYLSLPRLCFFSTNATFSNLGGGHMITAQTTNWLGQCRTAALCWWGGQSSRSMLPSNRPHFPSVGVSMFTLCRCVRIFNTWRKKPFPICFSLNNFLKLAGK